MRLGADFFGRIAWLRIVAQTRPIKRVLILSNNSVFHDGGGEHFLAGLVIIVRFGAVVAYGMGMMFLLKQARLRVQILFIILNGPYGRVSLL